MARSNPQDLYTYMFTQNGDEWKEFPKSVATRAHYCRQGIHAEVAHKDASHGKYLVVMKAAVVLKTPTVHTKSVHCLFGCSYK